MSVQHVMCVFLKKSTSRKCKSLNHLRAYDYLA